MTTAATTLLGLGLPVTGELSGTWGDVVNNSITNLLDTAIAGTTTISADADITLTTTTLASNQARQAVILWTAGGTVTRVITAPAQSKSYVVINATSSSQSIKLVGVGPTTGITIVAGEKCFAAWNGTDFVKVGNTSGAGVFSSVTDSGLTSGRVTYAGTAGLLQDSANLTFSGSALVVTGTLSATGVITAALPETNTIAVNSGGFVLKDGYSQIRAAVDHSFNVDVYNSGSYINAFKIGQTGAVSIPGTLAAGATTVTGTVSASSSSNGYLDQTFENTSAGSSAVSRIKIGNNSSSGAAQVLVYGSNHSTLPNVMDVNNAQNAALRLLSNNAVVASITSTGLAVTGDISLPTTNQLGWGASPFTCAIEGASGASGYIRFATNNAFRMLLDSSGNLGIGTQSPTARLTVSDSTDGAESGKIRLGSNATYYGENLFRYNSSEYRIGVYPSGNMTFYTTGSESARINSSGTLLVGTTSNPGGSYGGEILVASNGSNAVYFSTTASGSSGVAVTSGRSSNGFQHAFFQSGTKLGDISTNGSATSYNTASDYRLKENVQPMIGALAKVALLKPCTYKWKSDGSDGEGFIAHELSEVVPQCVTGEKDAVDEEGNPNNQGIDTSFLVATLTAAIQEQQAIITALTTRITALEAK